MGGWIVAVDTLYAHVSVALVHAGSFTYRAILARKNINSNKVVSNQGSCRQKTEESWMEKIWYKGAPPKKGLSILSMRRINLASPKEKIDLFNLKINYLPQHRTSRLKRAAHP